MRLGTDTWLESLNTCGLHVEHSILELVLPEKYKKLSTFQRLLDTKNLALPN
jgi:hypothetical protein